MAWAANRDARQNLQNHWRVSEGVMKFRSRGRNHVQTRYDSNVVTSGITFFAHRSATVGKYWLIVRSRDQGLL